MSKSALTGEIVSKDGDIERLKSRIAVKDAEIERLQADRATYNAWAEEIKVGIHAKDAEIERLRRVIRINALRLGYTEWHINSIISGHG